MKAKQVAVYNNFNWAMLVGIMHIVIAAADVMDECGVVSVRPTTFSYLEDESNFWHAGIIRQPAPLFS